MEPKRTYYLWVVFAAFLLSVAVRLPNVNRPLSKHHEFNMAMVLNVCNSWNLKGGPANVNFCPVIDYGNPGDRYFGDHEMLKDGKLYYASLGPMQFILPYYFCKILQLPFTPFNVQVFSLLLELCTVFVFYAVMLAVFTNHSSRIRLTVTGSVVFLFLPNTLWFFSNGYSHETLILFFYCTVLYYFIAIQQRKKPLPPFSFIVLLFLIIAGIFTDWLMVFIVIGFVIYLLFTGKKEKNSNYFWQAFWIIVSAGLAISIVFYFYSRELGTHHFRSLFFQKFQSRTVAGTTEDAGIGTMILRVIKNFAVSYLPIGLIGILILFQKTDKRFTWKWHQWNLILFLPPLCYTILFFGFSAAHDYAFLKFSFVIIIIWLFAIRSWTLKKITGLLTATILFSVLIYFYINRPGKKGFNGDYYDMNRQTGNFIQKNVLPDQFIYTNLADENLQAVIYYAGRNVRNFKTREEAMQHVKDFGVTPAVYVSGDSLHRIIEKLN
jgi:hypothetical protein